MKALILTHGTRGDCQPFVDLANSLSNAGHKVVLGAPKNSARRVAYQSIDVVEFDDLVEDMLQDPIVRAGMALNFRGIRGKRGGLRFSRRLKDLAPVMLNDMHIAAQTGGDVVIHHGALPGQEIAKQLGVPAARTCLAPFLVPNSSVLRPSVQMQLPKILNRASYFPGRLTQFALERIESIRSGSGNGSRHTMPFRDKSGNVVIHAFSGKILPPGTRYPSWVHTTGFWYPKVESQWRPSSDLESFLSSGDAPVYIGFGSMVGDPRRSHEIIHAAVQKANVRAIISTGWGGITRSDSSDQIFYIGEASFEWLFPRVAAVVHHGGCGTTSPALYAGKPQVICPFIVDQHFFARQMHMLRVAPEPLPQRNLDATTLARRIRQVVEDRTFATRAEEVAQVMRPEDGIGSTISLLEELSGS